MNNMLTGFPTSLTEISLDFTFPACYKSTVPPVLLFIYWGWGGGGERERGAFWVEGRLTVLQNRFQNRWRKKRKTG